MGAARDRRSRRRSTAVRARRRLGRHTPGRAAPAAVLATPCTAWMRCRPRTWPAAGSTPRSGHGPPRAIASCRSRAPRRPARAALPRRGSARARRRAPPSRRPGPRARTVPTALRAIAIPCGPQRPRVHGLALAFHRERFEFGHLEPRVRMLQHLGRGVDLVRACLGHEPRRQVHPVPHHRVRPPVPRADVAGEHTPSVHADAERQRQIGVGDRPEGEQHALLVARRC